MLGKAKTHPNLIFGKVLRELRAKHALTQEKLAFEANLQRNYVSLIERGINQPTITTIFKLAVALKIQPSVMIRMVEKELSDCAHDIAAPNQ
ncbi:MAG: helix-turn-helix domain-containing protein [Burkholderiales bacterium]|jgi:transcriptional regulator with XRE-family HTH domain|nr:helix-turn-helix domain-containing protein [Burkholderiales bacterium]